MSGANDSFAVRLRLVEPPVKLVALFWMGQASFALKGAGLTILIDPYLSEHPDRLVPPADHPEAFDFVDLLLITHEHLDHLDEPACRLIAQHAREAGQPWLTRLLRATAGSSLSVPAEPASSSLPRSSSRSPRSASTPSACSGSSRAGR